MKANWITANIQSLAKADDAVARILKQVPNAQLCPEILGPFLSQHAALGALPTLYAAVAPDAAAGGYYGPNGIAELKGHPTAVLVPKTALDKVVAEPLWAESERMTGVRFGELSAAA